MGVGACASSTGIDACASSTGIEACASSTGIDEVHEAVVADVGASAAIGRVSVVVCTRRIDAGGKVAVGFGLATVVEGIGVRGSVGISGVGWNVVVGVGPVAIGGGGNVGGFMRHVGVGLIGEGSVVDVEGDHIEGFPSSIGARGRWGSGVGSVSKESTS